MKKLIALCVAVLLCLSACAELVGMPNPVTEYGSLAEINEIVGVFLCRPPVMGVTDESFTTINCGDFTIAQYCFCVNGYAYTFRAAAVTQDISGVYIGAEPAFGEFEGEIQFADGEGMHLSRWFDINGQYSLCLEDPDSVIDAETFRLISDELKELTNPSMNDAEKTAYFESLAGFYMDTFSGRASLELTPNDDASAYISVHWANSAFEYVQWTMNVTLGEEGLWYYNDCAQKVYTTNDDGTETVVTVYENGSGFFGENEGVIGWNGAEDESCVECLFVKEG